MRGGLSLILSDNIIRISFYSSLIIIIAQCILILITFNRLPPLVPFLNSQPWGVERLYASQTILFIPFVLAIVFIINNFPSVCSNSTFSFLIFLGTSYAINTPFPICCCLFYFHGLNPFYN